jgi:hypothetical protein
MQCIMIGVAGEALAVSSPSHPFLVTEIIVLGNTGRSQINANPNPPVPRYSIRPLFRCTAGQ